MSKKLLVTDINNRLSKSNLKLMSKYMGTKINHKILCFCGKTFETSLERIFSNNTKSCGCLKLLNKQEVNNKLINTGIKLIEPYKGSNEHHKFLCHCGKEFICIFRAIYQYRTKSCGCIGRGSKGVFGNTHPNWKGYGEIGIDFWNSIKRGCLRTYKTIDFQITIEYAWNLFIKQNKKCAISGVDLSFSTRRSKKENTASLDRIDSSKGYTEENVQWIHKDINQMKMDMSEEKFFKWCELIYKNNFIHL